MDRAELTKYVLCVKVSLNHFAIGESEIDERRRMGGIFVWVAKPAHPCPIA